MSWYWWKRGRFAWAVGPGRAFSSSMQDGHGEWLCICGRLHFLTKPARD